MHQVEICEVEVFGINVGIYFGINLGVDVNVNLGDGMVDGITGFQLKFVQLSLCDFAIGLFGLKFGIDNACSHPR